MRIAVLSSIAWRTPPLHCGPWEISGYYVPNVVYTCGAILHNNSLIIPYGISDLKTGIAIVKASELIDCMGAVAQ